MPEAVIVATARTPDRPGQQGVARRRAAPTTWPPPSSRPRSTRCPQLDRNQVEDLIMGCGQPAGEAGYNIGRVVGAAGRHARRPRRDRQPLLLVVAADHPHGRPRHQGRRGRRVHRRRRRDREPLHERRGRHRARTTRCSPTPRPAPPSAAAGGQGAWTPPEGLPDIYIAMGQTAENVAEYENVSPRGDGRVRRPVASSGPSPSQERGFFEREITPVTSPDGTVVAQGRRHPRRHHRREARRAEAGVPPRRQGHRRQRLPAQRRRRRRDRDERHQGRRARPHAAGPHRGQSGVTGLNPEIMGLGPIEACRQALARAGMTIDDIDLVEINEAFAAQVDPVGQAPRHRLGQAQRQRRRHRPRPPLRHDRRPHHDHADQRPRGRRQDASAWRSMCVGGGQGMAMIIERL